MTRVAVVAVAVSMAVMVVCMAVIEGFRDQVTANLTGFAAHVQIVSPDNSNALETTPIARDREMEGDIAALPRCGEIYPFAVKGGILKTDRAMQGVMLKGFDGSYDWSFFREHLVEGSVPTVGDTVRKKEILVSQTLAEMLLLSVDESVEIVFISQTSAPRRDRFRIGGIYRTGFDELDRTVIPTDIRNVQRLNGWDSLRVSGYEVMARSGKDMELITGDVRQAIWERGGDMVAVDLRSRFMGLFDWLDLHNVNGAVIITIMLIVSLLNMICALLIILLERTQMIGTLKAVGMRNRPLQRVFLFRSAGIILRGMAWGNAVGLAACAVQMVWHPVKLDRAAYFLSEVPISLGAGWWVLLNAGSFAVIVLLMLLPTLMIARMRPDVTLRFRQ
jgi:lipoprotein-releasing system permease protein